VGEVLRFPCTTYPLTLLQAVSELESEQRYVIEHRWGVGRALLSDEELAARLDVGIEVVWRIHDAALQTLGFLWLTEYLLPVYLGRGEAA
jgi:DNA-directed RNA polymerase sigma subunit (sigma70/sigma32)